MEDKHQKYLMAAVGGGLGAILILTFIVSGAFSLPANNSGGWIYEYQTLIAGLAASLIGLVAASYTRHQYKDTINRRRLSEKAKMNDALSGLCDYARSCFSAILNNDESLLPNRENNDDINILKHAIEYLDLDTSEAVYELVIQYQVNNARLERHFDSSEQRSINSQTDNLYDAVKLRAMAINLFDYARKEINSVKNATLSNNQMHSSLNGVYGYTKNILAHQDQRLDDLIRNIDRLHPE